MPTIQNVGRPTIPSTRLATAQEFVPAMESPAVPSIVKGSPHPRQLFDASGFCRLQRGHWMKLSPEVCCVTICGDFVAGGGVGVDRMRILLDDLTGCWIDEAAAPVEDWDDDRIAAGGACPLLARHGFDGFKAAGAIGAKKTVAASTVNRGRRMLRRGGRGIWGHVGVAADPFAGEMFTSLSLIVSHADIHSRGIIPWRNDDDQGRQSATASSWLQDDREPARTTSNALRACLRFYCARCRGGIGRRA